MKFVIHADRSHGVISRHIYGHFAEHLGRCIYGGIWVGPDSVIPNDGGIRLDIVEALKGLAIPNLRWPGGCFADEYHWMDGIGPREERPTVINTHWGNVTENNHFGTHEFLRLCELLGCEPYINGNLGSGSVQEMSQWVEYLNSGNVSPMTKLRKANGRDKPWGVRFFAVGNENWGCGGNMRPEFYADQYRRYACYCRNTPETKLYRIACGPTTADYHWTEVLMREAAGAMDGLSLHYYTRPNNHGQYKGDSTGFDAAEYHATLKQTWRMEELITRHATIMDRYDPGKRVGLLVDEWGVWLNVEEGTNPGFLYQQNSMRDALIAAINLHTFNAHNDRVHMANLAQTVNVLQAVILTEGERMLLTPTYHVFEMLKGHQDAERLDWSGDTGEYRIGDDAIPGISLSASRKDGSLLITACNLHHAESRVLEIEPRQADLTGRVSGRLLTADAFDACNTFDVPNRVAPKPMRLPPLENGILRVELPPCSLAALVWS
jgi:alpha-L-arabinofuranosidase